MDSRWLRGFLAGFLVALALACGASSSVSGPVTGVDWRGARVDAALVPALDAAWTYRPGASVPSLAARGDWEPAGWQIALRDTLRDPGASCGGTPCGDRPLAGLTFNRERVIMLSREAEAELPRPVWVSKVTWELSNARCSDLRGAREASKDRGWGCA